MKAEFLLSPSQLAFLLECGQLALEQHKTRAKHYHRWADYAYRHHRGQAAKAAHLMHQLQRLQAEFALDPASTVILRPRSACLVY